VWTDQYTPSAGAIHSDRGSIRLNNCVLTNNRGLTDGAIGIQGAGSTTLTLDGCTVTGNIGDAGSATIRANSVGVVVRNSTIANNGGSNGGIWAQDHPKEPDAKFLLAYHSLTLEQPEAAIPLLEEVVALQPKDQLSAQILKVLKAPPKEDAKPANGG
jgi:hypothetical protein